MITSILAVLKTGAAYLPLDPTHPPNRLTTILTDAHPTLLITTTHTTPHLPPTIPRLLLDDPVPLNQLTGRDRADTRSPIPEHCAAYVIYTSGSTGTPKGVVIPRAALTNLLTWAITELGPKALSHVTASTSWCFDVSLFEIFAPLLVGGQIHIITDLLALAEHQQPAHPPNLGLLSGVPSVFSALLAATDSTTPHSLPASTVVLAGEALTAGVLHQIRTAAPTATILNLYGPTEATVYATAWHTTPPDTHTPPIGHPLPNTTAYVLDPHLALVPSGVPGELYLAGPRLARGYLHQSALTAQRFIANPHSSTPGACMYRTGDLARWSTDGALHYLGRADDQLKIHGHRIEPGEIETILTRHPTITHAAVTTHHHHTTATPHLTAYLVHHSHTTPPPIPTLRDYLRQRLPEYMVPSAFVVLERLPLTPNGKLDRHALPVPDLTSTTPTTPQTPQQQLLCRLFARVLNLSRIGIHDNFFDHGGHSLLANRLINGIRSVLGAEIPLRALFETPTPAGIAERLGGADAPRPALVRVDRPALIPLSYAQRRLWFLNRLEGASATYNLPLVMRLSGTLDQNALGAALRDLIDRHEPLRTVFPEVQSVPHQYVRDTCETEPTLAAIHTSARELPTELIAVAREGFDLSAEPPLRSILFVLSPHEHVLLLVVHHIAADGASLWPLARDLGVAYLARVRGCPPGWTPLPVHYIDYTLWQREVLGSEDDESSEVSRQLAYWRERLAGAPQELALPADRPRPALPSYRGREVPIAVGAEVHQCLIGLARDRVVTTFMVLEAAIAALLTRLGAGADIPIGSPVAGRGDQALDGLVGFFVNTLVLRIDTSGDPTFAELLGRVRESALGAYANQDAPFERLVEVLNPVRALARHPLFQVMFTLQNNERPELELPGLRVSDPGVDLGVGKFDLEFTLGEEFTDAGGPAGIGGGIRYSADLFDEDTAVRISARFVRFLAAVLADPQSPISSVDLLLPDERQMVGCVDSTPRGAPAVVTPGLFEAQVVRTPNRTALQYCDTTLSYRELNRRANRLAHRLIGSGIGPESVVALALPRSPDQIVAVLAVLKAGAAYAPIDPEYPAERISYLLSDAGCCLVLTHHEIAERLPDVAPTLALDDPDLIAQISAHPDTDPTDADRTTSLRSAHPAYLVYTSGSTGRPHGVVVSHEGIANLATNQIERFRVLPGDRVLQFASPGFDAAFSEVCMALLSGAELVLASAEELTPGRPLSNLLARQQITHLTLPPAALPMLSPGELDSLTTLVVAGDALPAGIVRRWGQGRRLINAYGPTETTVCVTMSRPLGGDDRPSIGHPIEGTRAYLLDDHLRPVPPGVIGELYVNGPGLARGYRGQPALTALRFVADPFGRPGVRMYRTGDLVRCDRHGELHFVGRADRQVSVRGFRVEPGEIEAVLLTCPDVAQAAVVMREDARGEQMMVGYVVAADGRPVDAEQLRRHVAASVPGYLVPARIVGLERFPLTPHGKLDHDALPAPQFISSAHRAARTPREEVLCGLFAEILGMGTVGIDDDFFDLGGHSMLAAALISRVHATLGIEMGLGRLFETPTVAGLAGALDAQVNGSEFDVLLPIRRAGDAPPLFCIHPAGGLAWSFVGLTKHVSTQHPIYGLQARGLEGPPLIASSVPEMAVDYLDQIRRVAPHGPYHLLGWSVGGLIAHEVAVLLQARGDLVATLAVLDAYPLADRAEPVPSPGLVAAAARCAAGSYPIGDAVLERLAAVYLDNARAAREFTPGIFRGDLLHFGAEQSRVASRLTAGSWSPHISGNIERHVVKCTHEEMTQSGPLAEIGAVLAAKLAARSPATAGSDGGGSR
ncbi:MAG: amino acid adenylation domain-containing protein [Pseudonocardiaceae bacterium]